MTSLSSRAARIFAHPFLEANPCNQIRCQQGPFQSAAIFCASRHRHHRPTSGNALLAKRTAFSFYHLSLRGRSSSPFTNKKNQPRAYRGIYIRRRHNRFIPYTLYTTGCCFSATALPSLQGGPERTRPAPERRTGPDRHGTVRSFHQFK